jgi:hypothetical protein
MLTDTPPRKARGIEPAAEEAQTLPAGGTATADLDRGEPGVGNEVFWPAAFSSSTSSHACQKNKYLRGEGALT